MNKITNHYFKDLFIRNKKILMLYMFVCIMAFPFVLLMNKILSGGSGFGTIIQVAFTFGTILPILMGMILPVFAFKFTLNKRNVDTFYALPINRSHLFKSHFIAMVLGAIVPILIAYLMGAVLLLTYYPFTTILTLFGYLLIMMGLFILLFSFNTFIVLKCNNVLDASIVIIMMAILPFVVYLAFMSFISSQVVPTGMINTPSANIILQLFSVIYSYVQLLSGIRINFEQITFDLSVLDTWQYFYFALMTVFFIYMSYRTFKNKKGESAEQLTTSLITYPFLINVGLLALIMTINLARTEFIYVIFTILCLFVVFVIAKGIANRSLKVTGKMVLQFVLMIVLINGFNYVSKQTEFFGINRRIVTYEDQDEVIFHYYRYYFESDEVDPYIEIDVKNISEPEQKLLDIMEDLQKEASRNFKNSYSSYYNQDVEGHLNIAYRKNHKETRNIHYPLSPEMNQKVNALINQILEK